MGASFLRSEIFWIFRPPLSCLRPQSTTYFTRFGAPETSILATPLAKSTENYLQRYKYARLCSLFVAQTTKLRYCRLLFLFLCHFTEKKRGMQPHCVRFFDPSRLKRSFFLKSAPFSTRTAGNWRQPTATAETVAP